MKVISLLLMLFFTSGLRAEVPAMGCDGLSDLRQLFECRAKVQAEKLDLLNALYEAALSEMPVVNELDIRKARQQLVLSQMAWREYVTKNCDFVGGKQGGSNQWVSFFSSECFINEIQKRIEFFRNIPHGG